MATAAAREHDRLHRRYAGAPHRGRLGGAAGPSSPARLPDATPRRETPPSPVRPVSPRWGPVSRARPPAMPA